MTQKEFVSILDNHKGTRFEFLKVIHDIACIGLKHSNDLAYRFHNETENRGEKVLSRLKKNKRGFEDFLLFDDRSSWVNVKKSIDKSSSLRFKQ